MLSDANKRAGEAFVLVREQQFAASMAEMAAVAGPSLERIHVRAGAVHCWRSAPVLREGHPSA